MKRDCMKQAFEASLKRVETGTATVSDARIIRAYVDMLRDPSRPERSLPSGRSETPSHPVMERRAAP